MTWQKSRKLKRHKKRKKMASQGNGYIVCKAHHGIGSSKEFWKKPWRQGLKKKVDLSGVYPKWVWTEVQLLKITAALLLTKWQSEALKLYNEWQLQMIWTYRLTPRVQYNLYTKLYTQLQNSKIRPLSLNRSIPHLCSPDILHILSLNVASTALTFFVTFLLPSTRSFYSHIFVVFQLFDVNKLHFSSKIQEESPVVKNAMQWRHQRNS